jgi:N-ethylmaleimide reductase
MRFLIEVIEAVLEVLPAERVGIRLSPLSTAKDMHDSHPLETFSAVARELTRFQLVYMHVLEGTASGPGREIDEPLFDMLRDLFDGPTIANNGYDPAGAQKAGREGRADMISFGRAFIAVADLATYDGGGAKGYTDFPALDEDIGGASA